MGSVGQQHTLQSFLSAVLFVDGLLTSGMLQVFSKRDVAIRNAHMHTGENEPYDEVCWPTEPHH